MRGSKHWPFAKVAPLWEWLVPAVRTAMSKVGEQFLIKIDVISTFITGLTLGVSGDSKRLGFLFCN